MKTRKILPVIALAFITICNQSFAQALYYQTTTTYSLGNNVSLKCDVDQYGGVTIYNPNSRYTYADQTYADGTALPMDIALGDRDAFIMTRASDNDIQNRVNSALTPAQKQIVGDRGVAIAVIVAPQTGKVIELFFCFSKRSPYNQLPPSAFRQIEQNFLSQPQITDFAVTDIGRKLNYVMFSWSHKFKQNDTPPPVETNFDYVDSVNGTYIAQVGKTGRNGLVIVSADASLQTLLNKPLTLLSEDDWTMTFEFTPIRWGAGSYFTIIGSEARLQHSGMMLQIGKSKINFNGKEFSHGRQLALGVRHKVEIAAREAAIKIRIDGVDCPDIESLSFPLWLVCHGRCVGQEFNGATGEGHIGIIHYIHIKQ